MKDAEVVKQSKTLAIAFSNFGKVSTRCAVLVKVSPGGSARSPVDVGRDLKPT